MDAFDSGIIEGMISGLKLANTLREDPAVKHCPTCTCNRVYKTAAERQKAYRERHKAKL